MIVSEYGYEDEYQPIYPWKEKQGMILNLKNKNKVKIINILIMNL